MELNNTDMAVIEQALREMINQGADYYKVSTYQAVLGKLQDVRSNQTNASFTMEQGEAPELNGEIN